MCREKLKRKLEVAGSLCSMEGLTDGSFAAAEFNVTGKKKFQKKSSSMLTNKGKSKGSKGSRDNDEKPKSVKPPKGKQQKKDTKSKRGDDDDDSSTLMKRRRKAELQIQVSGYLMLLIYDYEYVLTVFINL